MRYKIPSILIALTVIACADDTSERTNLSPDAMQVPDAALPDGSNDQTLDAGGDSRGASAPDMPFEPPAPVYELTTEPYTTLQKRWAPAALTNDEKSALNRELGYTEIDRYLEFGVGVVEQEGQSWAEDNTLARSWSGTGEERKSLLYFWQSADPQVIDEESPIRWEATLIPQGSMYRPQGHLTAQVFESHVRTARRIGELSGRNYDFAFVAGDLTDGGQENELDWSLDILAGGVIDPDSGIDNDPLEGAANDFTDPFYSAGIGVPWYVALGNHETLYMGTFSVTDEIQEYAVGNEVFNFASTLPVVGGIRNIFNGYRDARTLVAPPVKEGVTPADPLRRILDLSEVIGRIREAGGEPAGHGFSESDVSTAKGYYSFKPVPGKPIRFIVLNTVMDLLSVANIQGGIDEEQFMWLENELAMTDLNNELVFIGSHHRNGAMSPGSEVGARRIERLLADYENVVAHFVGHDHHSGRFLRTPRDNKRGYWELMAPSSVDFPMQSRIVEVVYEGSATVAIYITNLDHNALEDSLAHMARHLAAGRKFFWDADYRDDWDENRNEDNIIVRVEIPSRVASNLENQTWPARIESEETLAKFHQGD